MSEPEETATILVADDSTFIRTLVSSIIKKMGYNPVMALDGDDCIEYIKTHPIDLLLLDMNMPGKTGIEVLYLYG